MVLRELISKKKEKKILISFSALSRESVNPLSYTYTHTLTYLSSDKLISKLSLYSLQGKTQIQQENWVCLCARNLEGRSADLLGNIRALR